MTLVQMTWSSLLVSCLTLMAVIQQTAFCHHAGDQAVLENSDPLQSAIRDALLASSIIPDVLDDFTPSFTLILAYPDSHSTVQLGNTLDPFSVTHEPVYQFHRLLHPPVPPHPPKNHSYTLVLTDPDAKSRRDPKWSEMCHWIVANVSTPEFRGAPWVLDLLNWADENDGEGNGKERPRPKVLKSYLAPKPPKGTGYHRYVFVLLQGDEEDSGKIEAPKKRKHWGYHKKRHGVRDWAEDNGLKVVGANFFYAKHQGKGDDDN